jgi:16S rRNA C967 or C1407 C5-methylase (RsmB/RsmF family)
LRKVLKEYLSEELYEQCVDVTGFDATRMRLDLEGQYDKVLCDVPCSSERHLLHDVEEFARWTPNRTKTIAKRQLLILLQAIQAAKKDGGGRIVYATCSISNVENDQVIEKALKKSRYECKVVTHQLREWPIGEATQHGWIVLPDTCGRWGPLFFCVLEKQGLKEKYLDLSSSDEEEEYDEDTDGHEEEDY